MKINKFFMGFGLVAAFSLTACQNDEPANGGADNTGTEDASTMYLNVRIKSANMGSGRAEDNPNSDKGEESYDYGKADEHTVATADFFFFDENKVYVTQAQVWDNGEASNTNENVEYVSNSVLVLKGLTQKQTPKYMVTVLNAPDDLASSMLANVTTLDDFRNNMESNYTEITRKIEGADKKLFVMTTTSYYADGVEPGTTELTSDNLCSQPLDGTNVDLTKVTPVDVYVERLAAKYTMNTGLNGRQPIQITISGYGNEQQDDNVAEAYETVYLQLQGMGVTGVAKNSFLIKNIDGFGATAPFDKWQNAEYYRSFWAKSYYYNYGDNTGLDGVKFATANNNGLTQPVYSNENTKPFATLQGDDNAVKADLLTNVVFTAKITDAEGEDLKLINFRGLYYKDEQFVKYVLARLQNTNKLNFYKRVSTDSSESEGIVWNNYKYVQVGVSDIEFVRPDAEKKNGKLTLKYTEDIDLYSYDPNAEEGSKFEVIRGGKDELNENIEGVVKNGDEYPVYFNGYTYYTIPVQHLMGTDNVYTITADGQFGVVRNHWYNFEVNKLMNMGEGVFNPEEGEDGDIIYPEPDPKKEKFALAARVNILSWKIVKQTIDL